MKATRLLPDTEGLPRLPEHAELLATGVAVNVATQLFMAVTGHYVAHREKAMPEALRCALQNLQAVRERRNLCQLSVTIEIFLDDLAHTWLDVFIDPAVLKAYGEAKRFVTYSVV